jgi:hypothetical protein
MTQLIKPTPCSVQVYGLPTPNAADLAEYEALDGVPQCLLDNAVVARTEQEAQALARAFVGDRNGYANNRDMPPEDGA